MVILGECFVSDNETNQCSSEETCHTSWTPSSKADVKCSSNEKLTFTNTMFFYSHYNTTFPSNSLVCDYDKCNHPDILAKYDSHVREYHNETFYPKFIWKNQSVEQTISMTTTTPLSTNSSPPSHSQNTPKLIYVYIFVKLLTTHYFFS